MVPGSGKKRTTKSASNKSGSKKRTSTAKKRTTSRKKRSSKKKAKKSNVFLKIFLILLAIALLVGLGYCLGTCWQKTENISKIRHTTTAKKHQEKAGKRPVKQKEKVHPVKAKPQLVIIIDDVHTQKQLHDIQHIGYPVTPSIFPPYTLSPHTPRLARNVVHYMIHLPMESGSAKFNTLSTTTPVRFLPPMKQR